MIKYRFLLQTHVIFKITFILFALLYLFIPFTNDVMVSFGATFQADYYGNWFENVNKSWNIRGFFYKHILYFYAQAYFLFFENLHYTFFPIFIKTLHLSILSISVYFGLKQARLFFSAHNINYLHVFYTYLFVLLTSSHFIILQAEEFSLALVLVMFGLSFSEAKWKNYLSAFFLLPLIGLKGITILYASYLGFFMLFLLYKNQEKGKVIRFFTSYIFMSLIITALYFTVLKFELNDLISATYFQKSFQMSFNSILSVIKIYIIAIFHIPALILMAYLVLTFILKRTKEFEKIIFLAMLLTIPMSVIVFQNKFFPYHYVIFLPIFLFMIFFLYPKINYKILFLLFFFTFLFRFIPDKFIPDLPYLRHANLHYFNSIYQTKKKNYTHLANSVLQKNETILFLSDGTPNYFITNKSYSRYFYPLPVQRIKMNAKLKYTEVYAKTYEEILNYKGKHILLQPNWFDMNLFSEIDNKLKIEYTLIFKYINQRTPSGTIFVFERVEQ